MPAFFITIIKKMPKILTPRELKQAVEAAANYIKNTHVEYEAFGYTALQTGLRVNEILNINNYVVTFDSVEFKIRTEKTNNIRTIPIEQISSLIIQRLTLGIPAFMRITYFTLNLQLKKGGLYGIKVNGAKPETAHLFRHNFAKQLYIQTRSIDVVADTLRITKGIAEKYVNSIIEKDD